MLRQLFWQKYKSLEIREHRLLYLFLEVTRSCNLSCRHCGSDCGANDRSAVLSAGDWNAIVDAVSARYSRDLLFVITGGEPLVWPGLEGLCRRIRSRGRRWGMVTNGFLLDERRLAGLLDAGIGSITVSLDGDEEAHNGLRGHPQAYARALHALRLVGAADIPFRDAVTCVYPGNLEKLDLIAETLLGAGIPAWRLFRIFPLGRARGDASLMLDERSTMRLVEWIRVRRLLYARRGLRVDLSCEGWYPFALDRRIRTEPFFCRSGVNIATIRCDGAITGCANNGPAFQEGNIFRDDFAVLWEKGFLKLRDRSWMRRGICAQCGHFRQCGGGSAHLWDVEAGSILFCPIAR